MAPRVGPERHRRCENPGTVWPVPHQVEGSPPGPPSRIRLPHVKGSTPDKDTTPTESGLAGSKRGGFDLEESREALEEARCKRTTRVFSLERPRDRRYLRQELLKKVGHSDWSGPRLYRYDLAEELERTPLVRSVVVVPLYSD